MHIDDKGCPCEDKNTDVTDKESLEHWVESIKKQERDRIVEMIEVEQQTWDKADHVKQYSPANVHYSIKNLKERIEKNTPIKDGSYESRD